MGGHGRGQEEEEIKGRTKVEKGERVMCTEWRKEGKQREK